MQIKYTVDENHLIRGFAYHDGRLMGVLDEGEDKVLVIRNGAGENVWMRFAGTKRFLVNNFLDGNILSEIFLWRLSDKDLHRGLFSRFLEDVGFADVDQFAIDKLIDANPSGCFVKIDCSYGADIGVMCSGVTVESRSSRGVVE